MNKIGTITISVFQSINKNNTAFKIESDSKDIEQISYVIEDALNAFQTNFVILRLLTKYKKFC